MRVQVTIRFASKVRKTVETRNPDGTPGRVHTSALNSERLFREAQRDTGIPADVIRLHADRVRAAHEVEEFCFGEDDPPFTVSVRGRLQPSSAAVSHAAADPLDALRAALDAPHPGPEPIVSWEGSGRLAAVDLDFHQVPYDLRPTHDQLRDLAELVEPRARVVWSTHGRGLRLIYTPAAGYTAGELAGVAALSLISREPSARVELKSITRHPGHPRGGQTCGPVGWLTGDCDLAAVRSWLGRQTVEAGEVLAWLDGRGMSPGRRYPHSRCPVRPDDTGGRDPVAVHDGGVFCHACAGRGVVRGSRKPGWFPFGALCGRTVDTTLSACLRRFCHWEHAQFVVEDATGMTGDTARQAYSAALKVLHGVDDPRVPLALTRGHNIVRLQGGWAHLDGTPYVKPEAILETFPAAAVPTGEGRVAGCRATVARLLQATDLTGEGYPALTPVRGHRIYTYRLPARNPLMTPVVIQTGDLSRDLMSGVRPRYRPAESRVPVEDAWGMLGRILPGLCREYVTLIIAARGCQEGEGGLPPMIFACGPTGASKTASIHVAAAIMGDCATEVLWSSTTERIRQGMLTAKEAGSICVFNEFLKDSLKDPAGAVNAMDLVLNITPGSVSHALYRGPVRLGTPPVCVWTDTTIPAYVRQSGQVARRIVGVELTRSVRWEDGLAEHGLTGPAQLRTQGGPDVVAACDAILSDVIDAHFSAPADFVAIARSLGYGLLTESLAGDEGRAQLRDFFSAVCRAPSLEETNRRLGGRGWVEVPPHSETELSALWRDLMDEGGRSSRRLTEVDWSQLIGCTRAVSFQIKAHGRCVYVRFYSPGRSAKDYCVNAELNAPVATPPDAVTHPYGDLSWLENMNPAWTGI